MADHKVLAWVHFSRAPSELYLCTSTAGTEKEMTSQSAGAALGDVAGQVVVGIDIQVEDAGALVYSQITSSDGGQVINILGGKRMATGGSTANSNMNQCATGLSIPVVRGMTLNVKTLD